MSDLESFSGSDDRSEGMDAAAFEKFKERMAAAAAQLKAIQAGEQKQRKKEDELIKILLKFIQSGQKHDIMILIIKLLEDNMPAAFIVSVLLISNNDIQQELGLKLLPSPQQPLNTQTQTLPDRYMGDQTLPLHIKIAIDGWIAEMAKYALEHPQRILVSAVDSEGNIKRALLQLSTFCLQEFLEEHRLENNYDMLRDFLTLMLQGIVKKVEEQQNKKRLGAGN